MAEKKESVKVAKSGKSNQAIMNKSDEDKPSKPDKTAKKKAKETVKKDKTPKVAGSSSLLADDKAVDPVLSSLFAAKPTTTTLKPEPQHQQAPHGKTALPLDVEDDQNGAHFSIANDAEKEAAFAAADGGEGEGTLEAAVEPAVRSRKRKRREVADEVEDVYMRRLAKEEEKEAAAVAEERAGKRQKSVDANGHAGLTEEQAGMQDEAEVDIIIDDEEGDDLQSSIIQVGDAGSDEDMTSPPPQHETQQTADLELSKANRTVFFGNVSTTAITSKSARKILLNHLTSFFPLLPLASKADNLPSPKHKLESLRFRSTPYAPTLPKKAAFARKELMDATTKSTNAYAVYSTPALAREAATRLNGSLVLDRHLRADQVAHPAPIDHRRCVFVGNLGFVDDESNILAANAAEGREERKRAAHPADAEEGLWRAFASCGQVESVRVVRDSSTRVGKGIAYVQFSDGNAVEKALLMDGKKFPPMLPRKLRVARAKALKRNAKPGSGRPGVRAGPGGGNAGAGASTGYQRKISAEEASKIGRAGKLLGRAAAALQAKERSAASSSAAFGTKRKVTGGNMTPLGERGTGAPLGTGIQAPETFVFEGHRASIKRGKSGLKLGRLGGGGKKGKAGGVAKKGRPAGRSAKRGAAFKKAGGKAHAK